MGFNDDDNKDGPGKRTSSQTVAKIEDFESRIRKAIKPSDEFNTTYVVADLREAPGRFLLGVVGNKLKQLSIAHSHRDIVDCLLRFVKNEPESYDYLGLIAAPSGKVVVIFHVMRVGGPVSDDVHPFVVQDEEIKERLKPILENM